MSRLELSSQEKDEIIKYHLPYKITQLKTHVYYNKDFNNNTLEPKNLQHKYKVCALEIGFIAGRLFLEFLGLTMAHKKLVEKQESQYRNDDITVRNFNCDPVKLSDLSENEIRVLTIFYNRGNKGAGHFTWEKREIDGWQHMEEGVKIIVALLKKNFYDRLSIEMTEQEE